MAANSNHRRWFDFRHGNGARTNREADPLAGPAHDLSTIAESPSAPRQPASVVHTIEDILFGIAIAAIALDDRIPASLARHVVDLLIEAHHEGHAQELVAEAKIEIAETPDWECEHCSEHNPAAFEICWNCAQPQPAGCIQPSTQSTLILELESTADLRTAR